MKSSDYFKKGSELCLNHAIDLLKIADLSSQHESYGIACSLNILGAEEIIKASFLYLKYVNPTQIVENEESIFKDHKVKHQQLIILLNLYPSLKENVKTYLSKIELEIAKRDKIQSIMNHDNVLQMEIRYMKDFAESNYEPEPIVRWLQNANQKKNKGLYVNENSEKWHTPKSITKQQFEKERGYTRIILDINNMLTKIITPIHS